MENAALKERLLQYSKDILLPGDFHDKLAPAVMGYADMLLDHFGLDGATGRAHVQTQYGNAIGAFWAGRCVREVLRTQRFVRALYAEVSGAMKVHKRPVHVLYAGTGPFAALALPVMMMLKPEEVQFTFLEINRESIEILNQVLDLFNLRSYVKSIEECDASLWEISASKIDIVISETMNKALFDEPQVAIMLNLASQLPKGVIFLPEEIKVSLCKVRNDPQQPETIAELINFNAEMMYAIIDKSEDKNWQFKDQQVELQLSAGEKLHYLTEIKVNERNVLNLNDSSLNLLWRLKTEKKGGVFNLNFKYHLAKKPHFVVTELG
jgi:predicted RNA methylase